MALPTSPKKPRRTKEERLMACCLKYFKDQRIGCVEDINQTDRVIENAYDFIADIGKIIGYWKDPDDKD